MSEQRNTHAGTSQGKPADRSYLEANLPLDLQKAIKDYQEGLEKKVSYLDCLWDELYGSINANQWGGEISPAQADYLRSKYLFDDEEE